MLTLPCSVAQHSAQSIRTGYIEDGHKGETGFAAVLCRLNTHMNTRTSHTLLVKDKADWCYVDTSDCTTLTGGLAGSQLVGSAQ